MSTAKHTPGPWATRDDRPHWIDVVTVSGDRIVSVDKEDTDYAEADARLIAASPDLLGALQEFQYLMNLRIKELGFLSNEMQIVLDKSEKAIAKATGE